MKLISQTLGLKVPSLVSQFVSGRPVDLHIELVCSR